MIVELIIDNRENIKDLFLDDIDEFKKSILSTIKKSEDPISIDIKTENLDIGDYLIKIDNNPVIIIERKTVTDLAQSIRDGRHREQKQRLFSTYEKSQILFLIEGNIFTNNPSYNMNKVDTYTILSSIFNTQFRDNCHVIFSYRDETSVILIKNLIIKMIKNGGKIIDVESGGGTHQEQLAINGVKTKKKENINNLTSLITFLSSIPNVSAQYASELCEAHEFKKITDLIDFVRNYEDKNKAAIDLCEKHYEKYKKRRQLKACQDIISFL